MHSSSPNGSAARRVALEAFAILAGAFLLALGVNALRPAGIPVIATVPYDIFAPCRDSEQIAESLGPGGLGSLADSRRVIVVDARSKEQFQQGSVQGAVNVPFSVLFGAADSDLNGLRTKLAAEPEATVLVFGAAAGVELAGPLAAQLKEIGITNVKQIEGGLTSMRQGGFEIRGELR